MKHKNIRIAIVLAVLVILFAAGGLIVVHERLQNSLLNDLQGQIRLLSAKLDSSPAALFTERVSDSGFDYLAIGNSITYHGLCDYWWGEWGMAATEESHDYYHLVTEGLKLKLLARTSERTGEENLLNTAICNGYIWEAQAHDRDETFEILDKWLVPGIDLISIQLSENCNDLTTFGSDFKSLLQHIQSRCGDSCQILVIDDFWSDEKSAIKKQVVNELGIDFVELSDIRGEATFQAGMNTMVQGADGQTHFIEHSGVAAHPGDKGMEVIAESVLTLVRCLQ